MKLLLDENVTPKLKIKLIELGFDAITTKDANLNGKPDEDVFDYAIRDNRIVVTQNCKDFEIQIKPKGDIEPYEHYGLFMLKYDLTKSLIESTSTVFKCYYINVSSGCTICKKEECSPSMICHSQLGVIVNFIKDQFEKLTYTVLTA